MNDERAAMEPTKSEPKIKPEWICCVHDYVFPAFKSCPKCPTPTGYRIVRDDAPATTEGLMEDAAWGEYDSAVVAYEREVDSKSWNVVLHRRNRLEEILRTPATTRPRCDACGAFGYVTALPDAQDGEGKAEGPAIDSKLNLLLDEYEQACFVYQREFGMGKTGHIVNAARAAILALLAPASPVVETGHWDFCIRAIDASKPCNCLPPYARPSPGVERVTPAMIEDLEEGKAKMASIMERVKPLMGDDPTPEDKEGQ
ncbi:MAG: hypothetical protein ABIY63_13275 [Fibrobacteria bacterium]